MANPTPQPRRVPYSREVLLHARGEHIREGCEECLVYAIADRVGELIVAVLRADVSPEFRAFLAGVLIESGFQIHPSPGPLG